MEDILKWWPVAMFLFQAFFGWIMWSLARKFVTREHCEATRASRDADRARSDKAVADRVAGVDGRVCAAHAALADAPSPSEVERLTGSLDGLSADVAALGTDLEAVRGDVKEVKAMISGVRDGLSRMEKQNDLLMEHHIRGRK
ncbi:hypothetical protein G3N56_11735 [Desulfovibrio sulfodismutans]|uniref:DUF2730 family protein n=1 Tax=Desulfolutivibrio sulfodismutans TaxID=63561 RepID=A0A7K3NMI6_9BACT|nr:hypothetical protein [Desulfolutivibrio sulfodismutans]NDY57411.1 hypothetical protein [Desulfolutivibrio sulfodismutans]QLA11894.1 hypothetical protein GD606_06270 [Desulfolutivibrio sulfodismutans DSM 3696]QLA13553.1 hypothetical protein GD606_15405 [Desulfolutivibrio sulfodismutans DSM 3696]